MQSIAISEDFIKEGGKYQTLSTKGQSYCPCNEFRLVLDCDRLDINEQFCNCYLERMPMAQVTGPIRGEMLEKL